MTMDYDDDGRPEKKIVIVARARARFLRWLWSIGERARCNNYACDGKLSGCRHICMCVCVGMSKNENRRENTEEIFRGVGGHYYRGAV